MLKEKKDFLLYFHINPIRQEIFYIGIGSATRPYAKNNRGIFWHRTVKKYGYDIIIIYNNLSWGKACELEVKYIKQIGKRNQKEGPLVNLTVGGDGRPGLKLSEEHKLKISLANKGKK
jgi:hypothetical protein